MPLLGFGTWQVTGRACYAAVRTALEVGYRHIDTAIVYDNEDEVGRALRDSGVPRDEVFLTTKIPAREGGRHDRALSGSLRRLDVDHVDLWMIHSPARRGPDIDLWREMAAARDRGLTRAIAVSNHSVAQIDALIAATGERPAVDQIPWAPVRYDARVVDALAQRSIVLEGYSALKFSDLDDPVLRQVAAQHGVTTAQVVLRWHLDHGFVAIPKSVTAQRIAENFDVLRFSLSDEERHRIDDLGARR
jgi:2,5-diketo-D-gluconate reductase A